MYLILHDDRESWREKILMTWWPILNHLKNAFHLFFQFEIWNGVSAKIGWVLLRQPTQCVILWSKICDGARKIPITVYCMKNLSDHMIPIKRNSLPSDKGKVESFGSRLSTAGGKSSFRKGWWGKHSYFSRKKGLGTSRYPVKFYQSIFSVRRNSSPPQSIYHI